MPYDVRKSGEEWEVYNSDSGHVVGTHGSRKKANAHLKALYANVPDAGKSEKITLTVSQIEQLADIMGKSAKTPELESTPDILGPHGLWHTPSKKIPHKQKLPNYIEHIADALMRHGHSESQAIAFAVNAVKRWSKGKLGWGKRKVTPEVQAAAKRALKEWEKLKQSHH